MTPLFSLVSISALAIAGCASTAPRDHAAPRDHTAPPAAIPALADPQVRSVEVPAAAGTGQPREVKVLVDEEPLKLVSIVLRNGTPLPEHHSEVPVTIQALHGSGVVTAGGEQLRLDPAHAVVLGAKVPHAVAPDTGTDLVLLVHHLGRAAHHDERKH